MKLAINTVIITAAFFAVPAHASDLHDQNAPTPPPLTLKQTGPAEKQIKEPAHPEISFTDKDGNPAASHRNLLRRGFLGPAMDEAFPEPPGRPYPGARFRREPLPVCRRRGEQEISL